MALCLVSANARPRPMAPLHDILGNMSCNGVWPKPGKCSTGSTDVLVSPDFDVVFSQGSHGQHSPALALAFALCRNNTMARISQYFRDTPQVPLSSDDDDKPGYAENRSIDAMPLLRQLQVHVVNDPPAGDYHKNMGADESYDLSITVSHASGGRRGAATAAALLTANTVWGALYGLETFSQLSNYTESLAAPGDGANWERGGTSFAGTASLAARGKVPLKVHVINSAPVLIHDRPRFSWRGVMVDTSNHFMPVELLLRTVDALAQNKMNVLHW
jgi:hypothetical protein